MLIWAIITVSWVRNILYHFTYLSTGALAPVWRGTAAKLWKLVPTGIREQAIALYTGFKPDGTKLVQNAGASDRQGAWELTINDDKSVTEFAIAADDELAQRIEDCRDRSTEATVNLIESHLALTRRGKGGTKVEHCDIAVLDLKHVASRLLQGHFHRHLLAFNAGQRSDGTVGAILSQPLYDAKMALGAFYRAELAAHLQRELGLEIEVNGNLIRIAGVPKSLCDSHSTRRKQIVDRLRSKGLHSARAAEVAALDTRKAKNEPPIAELMKKWREEAKTHGFGEQEARKLLGKARQHNRAKGLSKALRKGLKKLCEEHSHWTEMQLLERVCNAALRYGVSGTESHAGVKALLTRSDIIDLGVHDHFHHYVTREDLELEKRLLRQIENTRHDSRFVLDKDALHAALDIHFSLGPHLTEDERLRNLDQRKALEHLAFSLGLDVVLGGLAGTGKTYVLKLYAELARAAGKRVTGLALAGVAARNLQEATGIECETVAMRLKQLDPSPMEVIQHHAKQLKNAASKEPTYARTDFKLTSRDIIIIDEAATLSARTFARIKDAADRAGAKIVYCGDHRQQPPIDTGSPFRAIARTVGQYELTYITRQNLDCNDARPGWARDVVRYLAEGESQKAIELLAERGKVTVAKDREAAISAMIQDWSVEGARDLKNSLILANTNLEADAINLRCREHLLAQSLNVQKRLPDSATVGNIQIYVGDRVRFTKISRRLDVDNGERGLVTAIDHRGKSLVVQIDSGRQVTVNLKQYAHLKLGYSSTVFSAQGATVTYAYHLIGPTTRQQSYVMASRGRQQNRFYTDQYEAGHDMKGLVKQMSLDRSKGIASDLSSQDAAKKSVTRNHTR